jgi:hypothetical protein
MKTNATRILDALGIRYECRDSRREFLPYSFTCYTKSWIPAITLWIYAYPPWHKKQDTKPIEFGFGKPGKQRKIAWHASRNQSLAWEQPLNQ